MLNKNNHLIYVAIYIKYDNNIIPQIPSLIVAYLLEYPHKIDLYLNDKIHVGMLLDKLASSYKEKGNINILKEIISFVEDKNV